MIKTKQITKHTICCPHCGGTILQKTEKRHVPNSISQSYISSSYRKQNEFDKLFSDTNVTSGCTLPTCSECNRQFQITINTNDFTIIIEDKQ